MLTKKIAPKINTGLYQFFLLLSVFYLNAGFAQPAVPPDRFAGLHFDFHANLNDSAIGKTFTAAMIDSFLTICKPDFIQVDCKGHPGISSYPTTVGTPAPAIEKDIMKIWRAETSRHHVGLYVHYSGILDQRAVELHRAWARQDANGDYNKTATSVFGAYEDSLLIPQLKEIAGRYHADGAWIDGDCWALRPDYGEVARTAFTGETGIAAIPMKTTDPGWQEWATFQRKAFRQYMARYINAVHAFSPSFRITSNWSFSSMMPEPVTVPVDFLSGDVAGVNGLYSAAFESRCMALQGKSWDLMSWAFAWKNDMKETKSIPQLQQEASEVLAMGGGYQTYWQQNRDGSPETYQFRKMADIIGFCRERKAFCFKDSIVPQVGLLYSTYAWHNIPNAALYSGHAQNAMKGVLNMLLDRQFSVEVLLDHQLEGRLKKYPVIVLPEWTGIDPAIKIKLLDYVKQGGNLLIAGAAASVAFAEPLGITLMSPTQRDTSFFASSNEQVLHIRTAFQPIAPHSETTVLGLQLKSDDLRFPGRFPLASIAHYGKGKIAAIYFDPGERYNSDRNTFSANLLQRVIHTLVPRFTASVKGSFAIHQVSAWKNGHLYIHLINTGGAHSNPTVLDYEEVNPLHNIAVTLQLSHAPKTIRLQPENKSLPFTYTNGKANVTVQELAVYSILEIE